MRQGRYLNVILTINAVLLTALLWTGIAQQSLLSTPAHAQGVPEGVPNAGMQRQQLIDAMREVRFQIESMRRTMETGGMKVQVTNLEELKVASGDK